MKNITKIVNEVATMFQKLGSVVKWHETMIETIDKHTEDSLHSVEKGRKNLMGAYKSISSQRALIVKVFFG
jgi:syntaxin 5